MVRPGKRSSVRGLTPRAPFRGSERQGVEGSKPGKRRATLSGWAAMMHEGGGGSLHCDGKGVLDGKRERLVG